LQYQIQTLGFTLLLHNDKHELPSERIRDQLGDTLFAELYLHVETWAIKYSTSAELRDLWIQFSCAVAATSPDEIGQQPVYELPFGDLGSTCFENWHQMLLRSQVKMGGLEEMSSMEEYRCKTCVSTFPREIDFERHKKWWKHREFPPEGVKTEMREVSNQYSAATEYSFR
jgi:hypothetical protein